MGAGPGSCSPHYIIGNLLMAELCFVRFKFLACWRLMHYLSLHSSNNILSCIPIYYMRGLSNKLFVYLPSHPPFSLPDLTRTGSSYSNSSNRKQLDAFTEYHEVVASADLVAVSIFQLWSDITKQCGGYKLAVDSHMVYVPKKLAHSGASSHSPPSLLDTFAVFYTDTLRTQ